MTSASTVKTTSDFFAEHHYFGLEAENVFIFQQGTLPRFTLEDEMILGEEGALSRAPDGNGGLYRTLRKEGVLDDMKVRGIKYIQLYCVDNLPVRVGDPVLMGHCLAKKADCTNKVVRKGFPTEALGIMCKAEPAVSQGTRHGQAGKQGQPVGEKYNCRYYSKYDSDNR